ncbi:SH3 domain-containing protein [Paracoccus sp. 1_MG-2023]|uniref:SH3 domain-containing protein n=1 Tax=unclassified Paracoccus (in: a-proteobacteria) TaxID=2688777 RepID=UPI001C0810BC|nr:MULTISPECIES: SH3 domain-containing protein [unclassified Paracoccus (in: a-proteobacteria)]MBU2956510.1 SH3 domain-containing protein [Paracoccus sp. C2R09]MDO6669686.1 SH3 domain-containing protein [Paracoccus sp. 1_MG-2023]
MLRLGLLTLATLVAIWAVLSGYGDDDLRAERRARDAGTVSAAQDAGAEDLTRTVPRVETEGAEALTPTTSEENSAVGIVQASSQTPERVERFPGPPLEPSPEHAGEEPAAAPAELGDGPRLYVTGSRVNMRSGPGTGNPVVAALTLGTRVEAMGPTGGSWVEIRTPSGDRGFMANQFLSPDAP